MDLFDAIHGRASVREYEPVEVSEDDLKRIIDAGRCAPSGGNRQPLEFICIKDPQTLQALEKVQASLGSASAAVAIVADPGVSRWWLEDASAAAENMLLAIHALGYASVWIEGTLLKEEEFAKGQLCIPAEKRFPIVLPIGKAAQGTPQADKRPLDEVMWRERYNQK